MITTELGFTKKDLMNLQVNTNMVLVRITNFNDTMKLAGKDFKIDTTFEIAQNAPVFAEVISAPNKLIFSKKRGNSMPYDVPMELKKGDFIVYRYLAYTNAKNPDAVSGRLFKAEDDPRAEYLFLHYEHIFFALRENKMVRFQDVKHWDQQELNKHYFVILNEVVFDLLITNGYILMEYEGEKTVTSKLIKIPDIVQDEIINTHKFRLVFLGEYVTQYMAGVDRDGDSPDAHEGDIIITDAHCDVPVQYDMFKILDKPYFRIHRRYILGKQDMAVKPLGDRVLIKPADAISKTAGGVIIPDTAKKKPQKGEVIAIGKKVDEMKVGDIVLYGQYAGTELEIEGSEHRMMRDEDVLAVL